MENYKNRLGAASEATTSIGLQGALDKSDFCWFS